MSTETTRGEASERAVEDFIDLLAAEDQYFLTSEWRALSAEAQMEKASIVLNAVLARDPEGGENA